MPLARHILLTSLAMLSLVAPAAELYAQTSKPVPETAAGVANSSAMRVYDGAMTDCFKEVMNVDPLEAARSKNTAALNMDKKHFTRIQDCMRNKGVPTNFENYFAGDNKEGLSAAQRMDLQTIQDGLDSGQFAPQPAAPETQQAAPQAAAPQGGMTIIRATPAPEEQPDPEEDGQGSTSKAPRPANKYWVTPE